MQAIGAESTKQAVVNSSSFYSKITGIAKLAFPVIYGGFIFPRIWQKVSLASQVVFTIKTIAETSQEVSAFKGQFIQELQSIENDNDLLEESEAKLLSESKSFLSQDDTVGTVQLKTIDDLLSLARSLERNFSSTQKKFFVMQKLFELITEATKRARELPETTDDEISRKVDYYCKINQVCTSLYQSAGRPSGMSEDIGNFENEIGREFIRLVTQCKDVKIKVSLFTKVHQAVPDQMITNSAYKQLLLHIRQSCAQVAEYLFKVSKAYETDEKFKSYLEQFFNSTLDNTTKPNLVKLQDLCMITAAHSYGYFTHKIGTILALQQNLDEEELIYANFTISEIYGRFANADKQKEYLGLCLNNEGCPEEFAAKVILAYIKCERSSRKEQSFIEFARDKTRIVSIANAAIDEAIKCDKKRNATERDRLCNFVLDLMFHTDCQIANSQLVPRVAIEKLLEIDFACEYQYKETLKKVFLLLNDHKYLKIVEGLQMKCILSEAAVKFGIKEYAKELEKATSSFEGLLTEQQFDQLLTFIENRILQSQSNHKRYTHEVLFRFLVAQLPKIKSSKTDEFTSRVALVAAYFGNLEAARQFTIPKEASFPSWVQLETRMKADAQSNSDFIIKKLLPVLENCLFFAKSLTVVFLGALPAAYTIRNAYYFFKAKKII